MEIGQYHTLKILRITPPGAYLSYGGEEDIDILLPTKYIPEKAKVDDFIEVFVYRDSEDRIICTTDHPHATTNQFAFLKVNDVSSVGAFLDWGIEKDILLPFREQKTRLNRGEWCLVYILLDEKTDRVFATTKLGKFYKNEEIELEVGEEVDLLIADETDLGVNVVINNEYRGLIYENDIFHDLLEGDKTVGYIKEVRPDNKIDVSLRKEGLENLELGARQIMGELRSNEGFLPLHDKSSPEEIQSTLQMSKKNFKRSIGILYKKKLITIESEGIRKA
ncbi:MAG: S1 RNA-binding domain-containing protein [Ekhidna sp.]